MLSHNLTYSDRVSIAFKFISGMFCRFDNYPACITLTAIHPDGKHHTPSRHIPLNQPDMLEDSLHRLLQANQMGWGAYVAIGLRGKGLTRYRRGGLADVVALPVLFVDVDNPSQATLTQLQTMQPQPSCIVFSGGGYHAYWWLDEPLTDIILARQILLGLARMVNGDHLSPAQILRLPGSHNTKPERKNALCRVIDLHDRIYPLEAFLHLIPQPKREISRCRDHLRSADTHYNPNHIDSVCRHLISLGYVQRGDWLCGQCIYPENHRHDDQHHSFGFNVYTAYGNCYRCGSILLKDIISRLTITLPYE